MNVFDITYYFKHRLGAREVDWIRRVIGVSLYLQALLLLDRLNLTRD